MRAEFVSVPALRSDLFSLTIAIRRKINICNSWQNQHLKFANFFCCVFSLVAGSVFMWDLVSGRRKHVLGGHARGVYSLAYNAEVWPICKLCKPVSACQMGLTRALYAALFIVTRALGGWFSHLSLSLTLMRVSIVFGPPALPSRSTTA